MMLCDGAQFEIPAVCGAVDRECRCDEMCRIHRKGIQFVDPRQFESLIRSQYGEQPHQQIGGVVNTAVRRSVTVFLLIEFGTPGFDRGY